MVIFANRFFPIRCGRTVSCKRFRSAQRAAVRFFAAATARHLSCGSRGGEKTLPFLLCATPSLGSRRRRRSGTGGFAWRTASHLTIACDNLLSVSGGPPAAHAARRVGAPENGYAAKRSSKPGAGSPLLTGGSCRARCSDGRPGPVLDAPLRRLSCSPGTLLDLYAGFRGRSRRRGAGLGVHLGTPARQASAGRQLALLDVPP